MKLIGIKFRKNNRIYKFCPNDEEIKKGDYVVVKKEEGESVGEVVELAEVADSFSLPIIERKATQEDREKDRQNTILEETAFSFCLERILAHKLEMKLVRVECLLNKDKLIFYYTADGRVDFRELLKDLVKRFKIQIKLYQIGIRNQAQLVGGIGPCGRELCCSLFLNNFASVSIKMAKDQYASLNPEKLSGLCGRLMCCLAYEFPLYQSSKKEEEEDTP